MKKLSLFSIVAGLFLAGCGENLPKEITSHENFKSCQQVEKNLLTIQSKFEKDERAEFYNDCNKFFSNEVMKPIYQSIADGNEEFNNRKTKMEQVKKEYDIKSYKSLNELFLMYSRVNIGEAQMKARSDNSYLNK